MRIEACVVRGLNKELTENLRTPPPVRAEGTLLDLRTHRSRNPATARARGPSAAASVSLRPNPEAPGHWASRACSLGAPGRRLLLGSACISSAARAGGPCRPLGTVAGPPRNAARAGEGRPPSLPGPLFAKLLENQAGQSLDKHGASSTPEEPNQ